MAASKAGNIACPGCGATYAWKPQLAGRKVRCKCGTAFEATPPRALPTEEPAEPDIFALNDDEPVKPRPYAPPARAAAPAPVAAAESAATPGLPGGAAAELMTPFPMHTRRRPVAQEPDDSGKRKAMVVAAVLIVVIAGGVVLGLALKSGMGGAKAAQMKGDDAEIVAMMESDGVTEVKEWIKGNARHMFIRYTHGQAEGIADRLYTMGAVKIYAFGEVISRTICVEMPDDPAKRKALLEFEREHNGGKTVKADVGQKYFLLNM